MTLTLNVEALKRDLINRFPVELQTLTIGRHTLSLHCVSDNEALLDRLIDAPADSLEVLDERLPYWSSLWPSSIALADALLANPPFGGGCSRFGAGLRTRPLHTWCNAIWSLSHSNRLSAGRITIHQAQLPVEPGY